MGLYEGCPWRAVVHIEDGKPGPRGGAAWWLTLECGHGAVRMKPSQRPSRATQRMFRPLRFAPKRVRCLTCGAAEPSPPAAPGAQV